MDYSAVLSNTFLISAIGKELVRKNVISKEEIINNLNKLKQSFPEGLPSDQVKLAAMELNNLIAAVNRW